MLIINTFETSCSCSWLSVSRVPAGKTHRELFDDWVQSILQRSAKDLIQTERDPAHGKALFDAMMRDVGGGGGEPGCPLSHASYALGYNLAVEFLADYEKRWMLESFRALDARVFAAQGISPDWTFLEVRQRRRRRYALHARMLCRRTLGVELQRRLCRHLRKAGCTVIVVRLFARMHGRCWCINTAMSACSKCCSACRCMLKMRWSMLRWAMKLSARWCQRSMQTSCGAQWLTTTATSRCSTTQWLR